MIARLLQIFLGCQHARTTFPITLPNHTTGSRTYCVCLDCGCEFDYDWKEMREVA